MISIIIPIYNAEPYLRRCLESVLALGPLITEILLIDDGCSDNSGEICEEYARKNESIRVFHTENRGASLARRFGLEHARGEYVAFVDSDDYVDSRYISILFEMEKQFRIGVNACHVKIIQPGERLEESGPVSSIILEGDNLFHRFFKYEFWGLCGKLYRKDLLLSIPFPEATISEDYSVMARLLHNVGKMAYSEMPLYYYEKHRGSLSRQNPSPRMFEEFTNVKDVYDFTSREMPEYKAYALSNAVETSVKLLLASRPQKTVFKSQRQELKEFLASHWRDILSCRPLKRKVAFLSMLLSIGNCYSHA